MAILSKYLTNKRTMKVLPYVRGDVLDIGCGNAPILRECDSSIITSYCGIERSEKLLEELKRQKYPNTCFLQCDLDKDQFGLNKQFDCILMIAIIEHLFNQKHVMSKVAQALKPGGIVIVTTPTTFGNDVVHRIGAGLGLFAKSAVDDHIVIYNRHRFKIMAGEVGLKLKHHEYFQLFCNQLAILTNTK